MLLVNFSFFSNKCFEELDWLKKSRYKEPTPAVSCFQLSEVMVLPGPLPGRRLDT